MDSNSCVIYFCLLSASFNLIAIDVIYVTEGFLTFLTSLHLNLIICKIKPELVERMFSVRIYHNKSKSHGYFGNFWE